MMMVMNGMRRVDPLFVDQTEAGGGGGGSAGWMDGLRRCGRVGQDEQQHRSGSAGDPVVVICERAKHKHKPVAI